MATTTEYLLYSHFNDYDAKANCYNIFKFNNGGTLDEFGISKVVDGTVTQVGTTNITGLGAKLIAGAFIEIKIRPQQYLGDPSGTTTVQIHVDGVNQGPIAVPYGDLWTFGYGLVMNTIIARNISIDVLDRLAGPVTDIT
jgi:hypothetical protein